MILALEKNTFGVKQIILAKKKHGKTEKIWTRMDLQMNTFWHLDHWTKETFSSGPITKEAKVSIGTSAE